MDTLFIDDIPSAKALPSVVNTRQYNKIPSIIDSLDSAKLEVEKQIKELEKINKNKLDKTYIDTNNLNINKLHKILAKINRHIDKLDRVTNKYMIDKAYKLIRESGALRKRNKKFIGKLKSIQKDRKPHKTHKRKLKKRKSKKFRRKSKRRTKRN